MERSLMLPEWLSRISLPLACIDKVSSAGICPIFVKKFAAQSKTKIDDIIVDMIEEPAILLIVLFGFWVGGSWVMGYG